MNNDTSHLKMEGFISKRSVLPNSEEEDSDLSYDSRLRKAIEISMHE